MKFIPLLKVLAANPPRSHTTPPPNEISNEFLSALFFNKKLQHLFTVSSVLFFSPAGITKTLAPDSGLFCFKNKGRHFVLVFASHKMKTEEKEFSFRNFWRQEKEPFSK